MFNSSIDDKCNTEIGNPFPEANEHYLDTSSAQKYNSFQQGNEYAIENSNICQESEIKMHKLHSEVNNTETYTNGNKLEKGNEKQGSNGKEVESESVVNIEITQKKNGSLDSKEQMIVNLEQNIIRQGIDDSENEAEDTQETYNENEIIIETLNITDNKDKSSKRQSVVSENDVHAKKQKINIENEIEVNINNEEQRADQSKNANIERSQCLQIDIDFIDTEPDMLHQTGNNENNKVFIELINLENDNSVQESLDGEKEMDITEQHIGESEHQTDNKTVESDNSDDTRTEKRLRRHIKKQKCNDHIMNKDGKSFICNICKRVFETLKGLISHKRSHLIQPIKSKDRNFKCALCFEEFDSNEELIKHKVIHKNERSLCHVCSMEFNDHLKYLVHKLLHDKSYNHHCIECGLNYKSRSWYKAHLGLHYDVEYECQICHVMVKSYIMENHIKQHKNLGYKCGECGKVLQDISALKLHMLYHTGVKPIQCLYCGKGFVTEHQREVHTRLHINN